MTTPFRTINGGAIAPTEAQIAAVPKFDPATLPRALRAAVSDAAIPDYLGAYRQNYVPENQGPTGCCTACALDVAMQACSLNIQATPMPRLSWGYGYWISTGDTTFSNGSSVFGATLSRTTNGDCVNNLYSEDFVLANWQGRGQYPASALPQMPACRNDAVQRLVTQWSSIPPPGPGNILFDFSVMVQLLNSGYPIAIHIGNHAMTLISVSSDSWWFYGMDSENASVNMGQGYGVRAFTHDNLVQDMSEAIVVQQVTTGPPIIVIPPQGGPVTYDEIIAGMQAGAGTWTAAQLAGFQAEVNSLLPPQTAIIVNGGFETPAQNGSYQYAPSGATWSFQGGAGISGNGNGFTSGNQPAPQGVQVGFIQGAGSNMGQSCNVTAGSYTISFSAAQRANFNQGAQVIRIMVDGVAVGSYQPPPGPAYTTYTTPTFPVATTGNHTIALVGAGTGQDFTAFVDNVALNRAA